MYKINYFSAEEAILLHDIEVIEKIGGLHGVKDKGRVFSVFEHLQNDDYYPDFETKLTVLVFNTVQFHMFNDGNKRSSIVFGIKFLTINHLDYLIPVSYTHLMSFNSGSSIQSKRDKYSLIVFV